jgi:hypothetical protein
MNDEAIEKLILNGEAILAEHWIKADLGRRIGEAIFSENHSIELIETTKNRGIDFWLHLFKKDSLGLEYAAAFIYGLPKSVTRKKNIIKGINMSQVLAGLPPIEYKNQKYIYVIVPSSEQVYDGINTMKATWGGFCRKDPIP